MTTRKLLHALAIMAIAFFAAQSQWLAAQSVPADGGRNAQPMLDLRHAPFLPAALPAVLRQTAGSQADAVALTPAKKKVYKFRSIDFSGANYSDAWDLDNGTAVGYGVAGRYPRVLLSQQYVSHVAALFCPDN